MIALKSRFSNPFKTVRLFVSSPRSQAPAIDRRSITQRRSSSERPHNRFSGGLIAYQSICLPQLDYALFSSRRGFLVAPRELQNRLQSLAPTNGLRQAFTPMRRRTTNLTMWRSQTRLIRFAREPRLYIGHDRPDVVARQGVFE